MSQFTVAEVEAGALRRDGTSTIQEVTVIDNTLHLALHHGLDDLRRAGQLCDVSLCVDERTFPCHRVVLAAFSPYFKAMFVGRLCESEQQQVTIGGLEATVMTLLLDFAYTASITINTSNVQSLLSGAHLLQVAGVVTACCRFLEHQLDPSNCLGILQLADTLAQEDLKTAAEGYVNSHFERVLVETELLDQSPASLVSVLSGDGLQVTKEEDVFAAIMRWMHHDHQQRAPHLHKVLQHVRLCHVSPYFLVDVVEAEPAVRSSPECRLLVEEARLYHLLPDRRLHHHSKTSQPRSRPVPSTTIGLVTVCGEDPAGVYHDLQFYDPDARDWKILTNVPEPLNGVCACVPGGGTSLYVAGGSVNRRWGNPIDFVFYKYDTMLERWMQLQALRKPRYKPALVSLNGSIYCVGGCIPGADRLGDPEAGRPMRAVEAYNVTEHVWTDAAQMPIAVQRPAVVALHGLLYVCGGLQDSDGEGEGGLVLDEVQVYNPHKDSWSSGARLLFPRCAAAAAVLNGKLYITGGCHGFLTVTNKMERYDPKKDSWEELAPMSTPRQHHGMAALEGVLVVVGGVDGGGEQKDCVEVYDPHSNSWHSAPSLPWPRAHLVAETITVKHALRRELPAR